jgi:hypothetical protein
MGEYGRSTTLIVTTDHGRGDENTWTDHGAALSEAKYIWLYATRINTRPPTPLKKVYTHIDIRPTIEAILNLKPTHCESCGTVMPELVTISDRTLD